MSAFLMVELTMRSVDSLRSFLAFMASLTALLMSSRSMIVIPFEYPTPDLGRSWPGNNRSSQPFDQSPGCRFGLLRLRQMSAIGEDDELRAGNALRHLLRKGVGNGVVLIAGQHQRRACDRRQCRPRIHPRDDRGLLAQIAFDADVVALLMHEPAKAGIVAARGMHQLRKHLL